MMKSLIDFTEHRPGMGRTKVCIWLQPAEQNGRALESRFICRANPRSASGECLAIVI
jgi:hypothetical protein